MSEGYRRWTPEEDERLRTAFAFAPGTRARVAFDLSVELDRTVQAISTRLRFLDRTRSPVYRRKARPFTSEEDAAIIAVPYGSRECDWEKLAVTFDRPITTIKHRRLALLEEREAKGYVDLQSRFRVDIPVSQPAWFDRRITRSRLMAGR